MASIRTNDSFDAEQTVIAVWEILARAIVPESGPDRDYLDELAAALQPGKAQEVLAAARAVLVRWSNHQSGETDREFLDELLMLLSGPQAISVAQDYVARQMRQPLNQGDLSLPERQMPVVPQPPVVEEPPTSVGHTISEIEKTLIIDTLNEVSGNRTLAAALLGISLRTLRNKLHQYADDGLVIPGRGRRQSGH